MKTRSFRAVGVCLILLCVILLTAVIVLCVTFISKNDNLTSERNRLIFINENLTRERDQLKWEKNYLQMSLGNMGAYLWSFK